MTIIFSIIGKLYLTYQLCALPASKETKRPTVQWKAFQERLPTEGAWDEWGNSAIGICILTGAISGNLIVLDFDDKGSRFQAWWEQLPEELRSQLVVVRTQSGGMHVYIRHNGGSIRNVKLARTEEGRTLIETRGEGGLVIAPPTPGYEIIFGSLASIPVVSSDGWELLRKAAESFDEMPKHNTQQVATTTVVPVSPIALDERVQRAIAYIAKMPEAISGQYGHKAAFKVAIKLHEFGLDIDTARRVFTEHYNPRCDEPWSEKEIDHKLNDAYKKSRNEFGCMLGTHASKDTESSQIESEPAKWQPCPLETLPSKLRRFVIDVSKAINIEDVSRIADIVANAVACVLAILSGIIGRTFCLEIKRGHIEYAALWVTIITDSGLGKSPALYYARKPIDLLQEEELDKLLRYKADLAAYRKWLSEPAPDDEEHIGMTEPVEPIMQRYAVADCTTEGLLPLFAKYPYGLSLIREEAAALFNGLDAHRKGIKIDRQIYIEIHDGRPIQVDRKSGERHFSAKTPSLAIIGGIQSDVIRRMVNKDSEFLSTGFGARFLMVYPPAKPIL